MRVNLKEIESNVSAISNKGSINFVYDLLQAYGKPKTSITRIKTGDYNLAKDKKSEIYWKQNIFFKHVEHEDLHGSIDELKGDPFVRRHNPRFIIVTDYQLLLAIDTKTEETLDIPIDEIDGHYVFFLPWAGMEKSQTKTENIADIKAAERMAKLYDEIVKVNDDKLTDKTFVHALNVFFSRLLFCFFAEDTEVFIKGQFTNSIASHTQEDGSDLDGYLDDLFNALDVEGIAGKPSHISAFPYVNGGLFGKRYAAPRFSRRARKLILECGELNWAQINPDIFGSMIQAVVHPGQRAGLGMHYTSVTNIMKVIEPLFLEELLEEFDKVFDDEKKLIKLLHRIYAIKVFDPACGSGNFLIIAYKELRKLEHKILERLLENKITGIKVNSGLKLENFYGIEIDDFAHEVAILSLWLAKHQMNIEFKQKFGKDIPLIPLKDTGNIACSNAARVNWDVVCPSSEDDEVYIIGNPPYLGSSMQDKDQKADLKAVCGSIGSYKNLDYIAIWFMKAARYLFEKKYSSSSFVSTNSISQGEQVSLLWPHILNRDLVITFAHQSFRWSNSAKHNAGVTCVIIALGNKSKSSRYIYTGDLRKTAQNINPYLIDGPNIFLPRRSECLSAMMPKMVRGSQPTDGGNLLLSVAQKDKLLRENPEASIFVRRYMGSEDLINNKIRYCLWIEDDQVDLANAIPEIKKRLTMVAESRLASDTQSTKDYAIYPNRFRQKAYVESDSIIVPRVSSERRNYIPIDYLGSNTVISDAANAIYNADPYVFGLISSRMHTVWARLIAGKLKTDFRYSSAIVYNNFPVPSLTSNQKKMIESNVFEVLAVREKYSERTLAELYDPDKTPLDLAQAHSDLDDVIEQCYRAKPFENDDERLRLLFKLYEIMSSTQKELI